MRMLFVSILVVSFLRSLLFLFSFFFNAPATTEIYTLSLHDALPIFLTGAGVVEHLGRPALRVRLPPPEHPLRARGQLRDRKSTRLNSSHRCISYAVFCLKKKKKPKNITRKSEHQSEATVSRSSSMYI